MKILVLGSGGREHALAWKLSQEQGQKNVFIHPGNSSLQKLGFQSLKDASIDDPAALAYICQQNEIKLVVIGPEQYLHQGVGDALRAEGLLVVGPNQKEAQLETSKVFTKKFLSHAAIPTAEFTVVHSAQELLRTAPSWLPCALKLDGLAAGKGVVLAEKESHIEEFAIRIWDSKEFGTGPQAVIIEKMIKGFEISYLGFCDGSTFVPLSSSMDYKRLKDGHEGPNTGGMGCVSPSPFFSPQLEDKITRTVVQPFLAEMQKQKLDYRGILYFGLMITPKGEPYVLEINARFGDPETQALMLRLDSSLTDCFIKTAQKDLKSLGKLKWSSENSIYVVAASQNYPFSSSPKARISGLDKYAGEDVQMFLSGTEYIEDSFWATGGRVLGIGGRAATFDLARKKVYDAVGKIHFDGMQYRNDIAHW